MHNESSALSGSYWSMNVEEVLQHLDSPQNGLSAEEAARRKKVFGSNSFRDSKPASAIRLLLSQFKSPIIILLIVAALFSIGLSDMTDAFIILFIILVSSLLGFWQERGAANAVAELLKMVQLRCCLIRGGTQVELPFEDVVPGDWVVLNAGDMIPADCLLIEADSLFLDEAVFTGETFPVEKQPGKMDSDAPLSKRANVLFMGSHVISGNARAVVVQTGRNAELGQIAVSLRVQEPETGFEKGIRRFGYLLMEITLLLVIIIFAINVLLHKPALDSILFSLALAVGLTPQLLPAIISINLSVGARVMAGQKVIVKRLSAIENFGSMNILCSDKTGTITQGKVQLKDTLDCHGSFSSKVALYAWLNASMQKGFDNPMDGAICTNISPAGADYIFQAEVPYDFFRKRLTIQVRHDAQEIAITKGAFDLILSVCSTVEMPSGEIVPIEDQRDRLKALFATLSSGGFRVLGLASKSIATGNIVTRASEEQMSFLGFITFYDPLKEGVRQTITGLNEMGVQLKLITGDNSAVANWIGEEIGFKKPVIITGTELRQMSDRALFHRAVRTDIFAEVEPNQKERIILALRHAGNIVGFMGDGINDAPALHAADVGISVDKAVDVAKEAADIVLLNQSLDVLITGIAAGRKTFTNTMKYIFMATSANFGNMFSMAGASLFLSFLPLLPKQILLTNLLTDIPEMAIATDKVSAADIQKPQRWDMHFIRRFMIVFGLISSVFDYLTFGVLIYIFNAGERFFQTGWLTESVVSATLIVLVVRTRMPFFKDLPGKALAAATFLVIATVILLPWSPFAGLLNLTALPLSFYGWMILIIIAYITAAEFAKRYFFRHANAGTQRRIAKRRRPKRSAQPDKRIMDDICHTGS